MTVTPVWRPRIVLSSLSHLLLVHLERLLRLLLVRMLALVQILIVVRLGRHVLRLVLVCVPVVEACHLDVARVRVLVVRSVAVVLMVCCLLLHPLVLLLLLGVRVLGLAHHGSLVKVLLLVPGIAALCHHKTRLLLVLGRIAAVILLRVRGMCADVA